MALINVLDFDAKINQIRSIIQKYTGQQTTISQLVDIYNHRSFTVHIEDTRALEFADEMYDEHCALVGVVFGADNES